MSVDSVLRYDTQMRLAQAAKQMDDARRKVVEQVSLAILEVASDNVGDEGLFDLDQKRKDDGLGNWVLIIRSIREALYPLDEPYMIDYSTVVNVLMNAGWEEEEYTTGDGHAVPTGRWRWSKDPLQLRDRFVEPAS